MLSSPIFARIAFYPSLLWGIATESSTKRWYDRIDSHVILGALPFKSQTKEVSVSTKELMKRGVGGRGRGRGGERLRGDKGCYKPQKIC